MQNGVKHTFGRSTHCLRHSSIGFCSLRAVSTQVVQGQFTVRYIVSGNDFVHRYHVRRVIHITDCKSVHSRFSAKPIRQESRICTTPVATKTVVAGHNTFCIRIDDRQFKGAQVVFSECLFRQPHADTGAVVLLIVQDKMLIVDINTFRLDTEGLCRVDKAREHSILGIVLKHTACIGRAMNV